ncbi:MAG: hypothetical protein ACLQQ4_10860 [Bacteroidia bacterium]
MSGFSQSKPDSTSNASQAKHDTAKHSFLPSLMGGVGVTYFNGNINQQSNITSYSTVRTGYTFGIEDRPVDFLGIQLNGIIGELASSERSTDSTKNKNFQSNFTQGELILNLHFDGLLLKKDAVIAPYIYTGFSFMLYSTYTDLYDAQGQKYYYWPDGTIRNEAFNSQDIVTAQIVQRSYNYSTLLGSGTTECVPVGLGAKLRVTDNLAINIQAAYYFTFTDNIEQYSNLVSSSSTSNTKVVNDKYLFSFCTVEYHFTKKKTAPGGDDTPYLNVKWNEISVDDTVKQTVYTQANEDSLNARYNRRDTSAVDRSEAFNKNPTGGLLKQVESEQRAHGNYSYAKLPKRFQYADKNKDGYITSQEITETIDDFFNGTCPMTVKDINDLIDYFFEQDDQ